MTPDWRLIEQFLLLGELPPEAVPVVRAWRLGSYAYTTLPDRHSLRRAFQEDYAAAVYQHLTTAREVHELLRVWADAGIECLPFKGFYLSEFVCPVRGQRPYADVDLLIAPEHAGQAATLAAGQGWRIKWTLEDSLVPHHHELLHLESASGRTTLDVHRWALHALLPDTRRQRRVTQQMWQNSRPHDWNGVTIRLPDPRDAVLIGLVLQRAWGDDSWTVKGHDWLDFSWLIRRYGLTPRDLQQRANELGVKRTLNEFLNLCNPFNWQLRLRPRSRLDFLRWSLRVGQERPTLLFEHTLFAWWEKWSLRHDIRRVRGVAGRMEFLHSGPAPTSAQTLTVLLEQVTRQETPDPQRSIPARQSARVPEVQRTVRSVQSVFQHRQEKSLVQLEFLEALTLYAALRNQGYQAVFCADLGVPSRYWVELSGQELPGVSQAGLRTAPNFCHPAS